MKPPKKDIFQVAKERGINLTINKSLDQYSGRILFPQKLEQANRILAQIKMPLPA